MEKIEKFAAEVEHLRTSLNSVTQTPKGKASYGLDVFCFVQSFVKKNSVKSALKEFSFDKLELANGSFITMLGTARVKVYVPRLHKYMYVVFHVLEHKFQPVIRGTQFLAQSGISLDFSDPGKCCLPQKLQSCKQEYHCLVPRI